MKTSLDIDDPSPWRRRDFLTSAGLASAGGLGLALSPLEAIGEGEFGETEHFTYRLAPAEGPWIDTQRGSRAFGFRGGKIYLSEDNSKSWKYQAAFTEAEDIQFSSLLEDGKVIFATARRIFQATPDLGTIKELQVIDRDGSDYRPHDLREDEIPGWYFYSLDGVHTFPVKGVGEMLIWGNYGNVRTGPVPVNLYYSVDGGETIRIAYAFGRNPAFQHKQTDPSAWLGDPENPVVCRHVHSVSYNPVENAFYACSGDLDRKNGAGLECHWMRGTYDAEADAWDWKVIVSSDANSRFKSGGINLVDGQVYWAADANGPKTLRETYDRGIFRCDPGDLPDKAKHTLLYPAQYEIAVMTIDGDIMVVPEYGNANPCDCGFLYSPDLGRSWGKYDLKELGDRSGVRVSPRNDEGWFRIDLRARWLDRAEVLFLKPRA